MVTKMRMLDDDNIFDITPNLAQETGVRKRKDLSMGTILVLYHICNNNNVYFKQKVHIYIYIYIYIYIHTHTSKNIYKYVVVH